MTRFPLEFLQAVNDWQKGGDPIKKGARIKSFVPSDLPQTFRSCNVTCYRQEAHEKERVWKLLADDVLPERIAGWTDNLVVAKAFKGGVPPPGLHGVIFKISPPPDSVILNLAQLYCDRDFQDAVHQSRKQIQGWHEGIGRYGNAQAEVILELESLNKAEILSYGGYVGSLEQIASEIYGREATESELEQLSRNLMAGPGDQWWLSPGGTAAVLRRIEPHLDRLRVKKQNEFEARNPNTCLAQR
jgi:hypothetical protein